MLAWSVVKGLLTSGELSICLIGGDTVLGLILGPDSGDKYRD